MRKLLAVVPALCAALVVLFVWWRPARIGDFGLGTVVGVLLGFSVFSLRPRKISAG